MLDVFFTVDVEVWCGGWQNLDQNFPAAYRRYIHGPTPSGEFGIPFQLKLLNEHKLKGMFFTEPLFSARFGKAPLQDLVGLIEGAGQETQLHLHTEWVDEARAPLLPGVSVKRQHMRRYRRALAGRPVTVLIDAHRIFSFSALETSGRCVTDAPGKSQTARSGRSVLGLQPLFYLRRQLWQP